MINYKLKLIIGCRCIPSAPIAMYRPPVIADEDSVPSVGKGSFLDNKARLISNTLGMSLHLHTCQTSIATHITHSCIKTTSSLTTAQVSYCYVLLVLLYFYCFRATFLVTCFYQMRFIVNISTLLSKLSKDNKQKLLD